MYVNFDLSLHGIFVPGLERILDKPWHICASNAVTGEGLPEGVEWLTGTDRDTAYLGRPNHNCTSNAVTGEGLPGGVEWLTGTARDTA